MLTYFVNIDAHSSIKYVEQSRVTGTIANKNEETTQYFFQSFAEKKR